MIVFFENGRVGNQLFQYCALKKLFPKDKLFLIGFDALFALVEPIDAKIIKRNHFPRWFPFRVAEYFFRVLSKLRLLSDLSESCTDEHFAIRKKLGLFFWVRFFHSSFFQHREIVEALRPNFEVCPEHVKKAQVWLSGQMPSADLSSLVFVHIRRGDYLNWPSREYPAVSSLAWYLAAMSRMKESIANPIFIILTDDPFYANDIFQKQANVLISDNNQYVDFALMSLCPYGILSASTYAWWAAFISREKYGSGYYIAPKYWTRHRRNEWDPQIFFTSWLEYFE